MKENLYRSMMEQIQLSDDADRRIRTALEQEVRRKRRHPLGRAGLAAAVAALLITTALGAQLLKSAVFVPHLGPQAGQWEEYVSGDTFAQCQAGRNAISVVSTLFTANSVNLIVEITPLDEAGQGALEENMLHCELQIHKPDGTLCVGYDTSFWNHPDTEAAEGLSFSRSVVVLPPETAGTRRLSLSFKTSYTGIAPGDQVTLEFSLGEDQASCTGTVQTVDASALVIPIAGSSWAQATVTPLSIQLAYGPERPQEPDSALTDLRIACADGTELLLWDGAFQEDETGPVSGTSFGKAFCQFDLQEDIDLSQVTGLWINGVYYPAE